MTAVADCLWLNQVVETANDLSRSHGRAMMFAMRWNGILCANCVHVQVRGGMLRYNILVAKNIEILALCRGHVFDVSGVYSTVSFCAPFVIWRLMEQL